MNFGKCLEETIPSQRRDTVPLLAMGWCSAPYSSQRRDTAPLLATGLCRPRTLPNRDTLHHPVAISDAVSFRWEEYRALHHPVASSGAVSLRWEEYGTLHQPVAGSGAVSLRWEEYGQCTTPSLAVAQCLTVGKE